MSFPDGTSYTGCFENGLAHGLGHMQLSDGSSYEGDFSQGKFSGNGVYVRKDGMRYEGQFRDGKVWGLGLLTFSDGTHGLPRNEGYFEGSKLIERKKGQDTQSAVRNAILAAERARNQTC